MRVVVVYVHIYETNAATSATESFFPYIIKQASSISIKSFTILPLLHNTGKYRTNDVRYETSLKCT